MQTDEERALRLSPPGSCPSGEAASCTASSAKPAIPNADRNFGDIRIVQFEALARNWDRAGHSGHAKFWRRKAEAFRAHHREDPHWCGKLDLPASAIEARQGGNGEAGSVEDDSAGPKDIAQ